MKYLLCLLLVGCSSLKKPVHYNEISKLDCSNTQNKKYLTKLDLLHCLGEKIETPLHKVSLSFDDLPATGPIANLTFYALTHGYVTAKSINQFGAEDYLTKKEFNQFLSVYKKRH